MCGNTSLLLMTNFPHEHPNDRHILWTVSILSTMSSTSQRIGRSFVDPSFMVWMSQDHETSAPWTPTSGVPIRDPWRHLAPFLLLPVQHLFPPVPVAVSSSTARKAGQPIAYCRKNKITGSCTHSQDPGMLDHAFNLWHWKGDKCSINGVLIGDLFSLVLLRYCFT